MRAFRLLLLVPLLAGCVSRPYRETANAKFTGALDVRWVKNDYFLFLPNEEDPLTLVRPDGEPIRPGPMYTDGGSIPRFLWGVKGFSPWGYAPAYVIHDWLFETRHCNKEPGNQFAFEDTVTVMAEGLRSYFVFDSVVAAVGSPIAKRLWDGGSCRTPPFAMETIPDIAPPGDLLMTIRFD